MNKVYLDKNGKLFVNGHEIKGVMSVSSETNYLGTQIVLKFEGDYKCDFISSAKRHSVSERPKE